MDNRIIYGAAKTEYIIYGAARFTRRYSKCHISAQPCIISPSLLVFFRIFHWGGGGGGGGRSFTMSNQDADCEHISQQDRLIFFFVGGIEHLLN